MTATVQPTAYAIGITYVIKANSADEAMDLAATAFGHDDRFLHVSGPYLVGDAAASDLAAPVVNYGDDWSGERPPELERADSIDAEASQ